MLVGEHPSAAAIGVDWREVMSAIRRSKFLRDFGRVSRLKFVAIEEDGEFLVNPPTEGAHRLGRMIKG